MADPKKETSENLPTLNDTDVQSDLPEATNGKEEQQKASKTSRFMVPIGGKTYAVDAENASEAGKKARALYDKEEKETKK